MLIYYGDYLSPIASGVFTTFILDCSDFSSNFGVSFLSILKAYSSILWASFNSSTGSSAALFAFVGDESMSKSNKNGLTELRFACFIS